MCVLERVGALCNDFDDCFDSLVQIKFADTYAPFASFSGVFGNFL